MGLRGIHGSWVRGFYSIVRIELMAGNSRSLHSGRDDNVYGMTIHFRNAARCGVENAFLGDSASLWLNVVVIIYGAGRI
jgi:hypothetical protein